MGLSRKQIVTIVALGVVVGIVAVAGYLNRRGATPPLALPGLGGAGNPAATSTAPAPVYYSPEVSKNATLSVPKSTAPASANPTLATKIRFFDLKAARGGFAPASFTVNHGDTLSVDFTAVDGDYDLDIPYLGAYFGVVKEGTTRKLPFDTSTPGTFVFQCRDFCPPGGKIQGMLIVLPG